MEINIIIIFKILSIIGVNFLLIFYIYRYVFNPNLKWWQKGNICHDERLERSFVLAIVFAFIETLIYYKLIIFTF